MGPRKKILAGRAKDRVEASILVRVVAEPRAGELVKQQIARAATRLGWRESRTAEIWRGKAHRIDAWELEQLYNWRPDE